MNDLKVKEIKKGVVLLIVVFIVAMWAMPVKAQPFFTEEEQEYIYNRGPEISLQFPKKKKPELTV